MTFQESPLNSSTFQACTNRALAFSLIKLNLQPTFELREVEALLSRDSRSESSSGRDIFSKISIDFTAAFWKASDILVGCIPEIKS